MGETAHGCLVKIHDLNCSFGYLQPSRKVHCSNHSSVISHGLTYANCAFKKAIFWGSEAHNKVDKLSIPFHTHPKMDSFTLGFGQNSWLFSSHEKIGHCHKLPFMAPFPQCRLCSTPSHLLKKNSYIGYSFFFCGRHLVWPQKKKQKKRQAPNISSTPTYRTYLNKWTITSWLLVQGLASEGFLSTFDLRISPHVWFFWIKVDLVLQHCMQTMKYIYIYKYMCI